MTIVSKIMLRFATIDENKSVLDEAKLMTEAFIGSVVVTNSSGIRGLFTERELAMNVVGKGKVPERVQIKDVMTSDPIKVSPNATASLCLDLMREHRGRYLLVFEGDEFVGIVSLRDMVALMIDEKEELIGHLERYITSCPVLLRRFPREEKRHMFTSILHDAPYTTEWSWNGLRFVEKALDSGIPVRMFLFSDAVYVTQNRNSRPLAT
jgi:CBS domain-containing protein